MIPDSRISRIRFEAAAYTVRLPTSGGQFKPMVDIHSLSLRFTHSLANRRGLQVAADTAFGACSHQLAPRAQRSFAPEALPSFMATTTSCASPKASPQLRFYTRWSVFAAWTFRCWSSGPSRRYYCDSFPGCLDHYSGSLWGASTRFFPQSIGLPQNGSRSALSRYPCYDFRTDRYFGAAVIPLCSGLQVC